MQFFKDLVYSFRRARAQSKNRAGKDIQSQKKGTTIHADGNRFFFLTKDDEGKHVLYKWDVPKQEYVEADFEELTEGRFPIHNVRD